MKSKSNISAESKPVLAIETSNILCGVSVYFSEEKKYSVLINQKNSHSEKLFPAINYLFKESNVKPDELQFVAISEGPGSFTGLRIGMSAAKGIAMGAEIPIVPVPTFEAFAFQIAKFIEEGTYFIIANKVNKDEVYYSKFQVRSNNYIFVEELTILSNKDFFIKSEAIKTFGNVVKDSDSFVNRRFEKSAPDPEIIAEWAVKFGSNRKTIDYDYLEPNYLKNFHIKEKKK